MATVELNPQQATLLKAIPEDGAVFYAHIALATRQTPGDVEAEVRELTQKGLVELTTEGTVRLTPLGVKAQQQITSSGRSTPRKHAVLVVLSLVTVGLLIWIDAANSAYVMGWFVGAASAIALWMLAERQFPSWRSKETTPKVVIQERNSPPALPGARSL